MGICIWSGDLSAFVFVFGVAIYLHLYLISLFDQRFYKLLRTLSDLTKYLFWLILSNKFVYIDITNYKNKLNVFLES